jgi:glycosyltransferase involved in cell wall biosynthesis
MGDGGEWPRITVVTPSYNQGRFIEETIRSILLQGYPNLEYIVVDGGSSDESVEIIRKYEPWIASWVSERDNGQSDAINKGFRAATGDIIAWLNSDDTYHPDALRTVAEAFAADPGTAMIYGGCDIIDEQGRRNTRYPSRDFDLKILVTRWNYIPQPATFFRRDIYTSVGEVDVNLHYSMDRDLWIRIGRQFKARLIDPVLANIRYYDDCKTAAISREGRRERLMICRKYGGTIFSRVYRQYILDEIRMRVRRDS